MDLGATHVFAFSVGLLAGVIVMVAAIGYGLTQRTAPTQTRTPDRTASDRDPPAFVDTFCNRMFRDEDEAKAHAIEVHNAPRDGPWQLTYITPGDMEGRVPDADSVADVDRKPPVIEASTYLERVPRPDNGTHPNE